MRALLTISKMDFTLNTLFSSFFGIIQQKALQTNRSYRKGSSINIPAIQLMSHSNRDNV